MCIISHIHARGSKVTFKYWRSTKHLTGRYFIKINVVEMIEKIIELTKHYPLHILGVLLAIAYAYILLFETSTVPVMTFDGKPPQVTDVKDCKDRYDFCKRLANRGECDKAPGWMIINCPVSCASCHLRDPQVRCRREALNISTSPIYRPGDIDKMFTSLEMNNNPHMADKYGTMEILSRDPWVVTIDNFLSESEIQSLTQFKYTWKKSLEYGQVNEFGESGVLLSTRRTSEYFQCDGPCAQLADVQQLMSKLEKLVNIPRNHFEPLQLVKYETGQFYVTHNDYSDEGGSLPPCGPRILTFFFYLSEVEEGGNSIP